MKEKEIKFYELSDSLYGLRVAEMQPSYVTREVEKTIATPHRHDYYSLILLVTGTMHLTVDFSSKELYPTSILLLKPGQVHETVSGKDISGWIMLFDGKIIDQKARHAIEQSLQDTIMIGVNDEDKMWFIHLFKTLFYSIREKDPGKFHRQFLQSLLNAFLYKTINILYAYEVSNMHQLPSRAVEITRQFNQLVKENVRRLKTPSGYAEKLNITVSYLNDTLKAVTGFSCTQLIQQEVISEAQRLLYYTSNSIKEIASQLGYRDYKYFIRLFSKVTNTSPTGFRKQLS